MKFWFSCWINDCKAVKERRDFWESSASAWFSWEHTSWIFSSSNYFCDSYLLRYEQRWPTLPLRIAKLCWGGEICEVVLWWTDVWQSLETRLGIIQRSNSPWASPLHIAPKPVGTHVVTTVALMMQLHLTSTQSHTYRIPHPTWPAESSSPKWTSSAVTIRFQSICWTSPKLQLSDHLDFF